jgi:hypothetical protein
LKIPAFAGICVMKPVLPSVYNSLLINSTVPGTVQFQYIQHD